MKIVRKIAVTATVAVGALLVSPAAAFAGNSWT